MAASKKTVGNSKRPGLGTLKIEHGFPPTHFRHESIVGNGFNGQVRHMWRQPPSAMAIPGKGLVNNG